MQRLAVRGQRGPPPQGGYLVALQYLSASGAVLASTTVAPITGK
jgi:hypothetical protein